MLIFLIIRRKKLRFSLSLRETTTEEVYKLIQQIPSNKASGSDGISARHL